jgi:hypothetical protein
MSKELKKAQGDWQAANASKDKELSEANHSRGVDPSKSAERGSVSQKLNEDSSKYRKPQQG